jgi:peptide/nickel transport system permease protein
MGRFILRRLFQAVFTIFGVMLLTFVLFNVMPGDPAGVYVDVRRQGPEALEEWRQRHGQDKPLLVNTSEGFNPLDETFYDSQFFHHLYNSVTFSGYSYQWEDRRLLDIIGERAKYSMALTIPQLAVGWFIGLLISSIVAYWRGTLVDHLGVFLAVLGMCVPFLAYIIFGQLLMFEISPEHAWGISHTVNIYVPVMIGVAAGVGANVRFYRTIILDQVNQDYVRTARAKGVPLPSILGKHVLKNCMLPILTSLVLSIPFLILGSLLLEKFFGIPGLGDLMINSITSKDVPLITGLTFLTALVYVTGLLITDVLYGIFDPRIRLK